MTTELIINKNKEKSLEIELIGDWSGYQYSQIKNYIKKVQDILKKEEEYQEIADIYINFDKTDKMDSNICLLLKYEFKKYYIKLKKPQKEILKLWEMMNIQNLPEKNNVEDSGFVQSINKGLFNIKHFLSLSKTILFNSYPKIKTQRKFMIKSMLAQIENMGIKAVPILTIMLFFLGIVLSFQSAFQLKRFGAETYTVEFISLVTFREIAPLFTGILLASRSGSAITAQIGSMSINQELEMLKSFNINPTYQIAWPKIICLTLISPILCLYAIIFTILGCYLIFLYYIGHSTTMFLELLQSSVTTSSVMMSVWKTPIFAFCTGVIACMQGFKVKNDSKDMGVKTTNSVVASLATIVVLDGLFSLVTTAISW